MSHSHNALIPRVMLVKGSVYDVGLRPVLNISSFNGEHGRAARLPQSFLSFNACRPFNSAYYSDESQDYQRHGFGKFSAAMEIKL